MSDTDLDLEDQEQEDGPKGLRKRLKELEAEVKAEREKSARLADLERELAFNRAGVDPADPKMKYFAKAYDGEMTREAIRSEAEAAGLLAPVTEPPTPQQQAADAHGRLDAAATTEPNPARAAEYLEAVHNAKSPDEVMAVVSRFRDLPGVISAADLQ